MPTDPKPRKKIAFTFEQRQRLTEEIEPACVEDPEYAAAEILRLEIERDEALSRLKALDERHQPVEAPEGFDPMLCECGNSSPCPDRELLEGRNEIREQREKQHAKDMEDTSREIERLRAQNEECREVSEQVHSIVEEREARIKAARAAGIDISELEAACDEAGLTGEEECRCSPCPHCGYKHYCNMTKVHPDGKVRSGGCPAVLIDDPLGEEE